MTYISKKLDPNHYIVEKELKLFVRHAQAKYNKGRKEHNDDLSTLDYDKEIEDELIDLVMYIIMRRLFKKK